MLHRPIPWRRGEGMDAWGGDSHLDRLRRFRHIADPAARDAREFSEIDALSVVLALLTIVTSYLIQRGGGSWCDRSTAHCPTSAPSPFLMIGLSANILLPLRSGDVLRVFLVRRAFGGSGGRALASVIVERLFDISSIVSFGAVIHLGGNWPQPISVGFDIMTALAITVAAALVMLVGLARRSTVTACAGFSVLSRRRPRRAAPSVAATAAIFSHAAFVCLQLVCGAASACVEAGSAPFRRETLKGPL
jgi:Lysylphosphatidylglycerol synthase TM region